MGQAQQLRQGGGAGLALSLQAGQGRLQAGAGRVEAAHSSVQGRAGCGEGVRGLLAQLMSRCQGRLGCCPALRGCCPGALCLGGLRRGKCMVARQGRTRREELQPA